MSARTNPKLQLAPAADEQALLTAYRTMDDRARRQTLRQASRSAETFPRSARAGSCVTIMVVTQDDEQALLGDYRAMNADSSSFLRHSASALAADFPARAARQPLRLVIGGRS